MYLTDESAVVFGHYFREGARCMTGSCTNIRVLADVAVTSPVRRVLYRNLFPICAPNNCFAMLANNGG